MIEPSLGTSRRGAAVGGFQPSVAGHLRLLENPYNRRYSATVNGGIAIAENPILVFLNPDTLITDQWLPRLAARFRSTDIAAVGPVSNHVAGAQNVIHYLSQDMEEAGDLNAFAQRLFERNRGQAIDTRLLVGFCLLVRREVVDTIGGFDEQTGCSNFEDDDFCIRANLADIRGTIARDCFVHQFGGRTFGRLGIPYCRQLDANWQGFREKWNISGGPGLDGTYMLAKTRGGFDPAKHYIAVGT